MDFKQLLIQKFPQITKLTRQIKAKKWAKDSIVYYVGSRKEPLAYNILEKAASGSYTALIYLCQEWAKLGRKVTVYSFCGEKEGIYDGVEYINYYKFNPEDTFDILIIFQHSYILPLPIKARKVCFDWHDIYGPKLQLKDKLARFDLIFAKSQYQRQLMDFIPDEKFVIITNGINQNIAQLSNNKKEPYKLIYASRYYRGLEEMLTYGWQIIKREIPEAQFHIYYGFVLREMSQEQENWRNKMIELMQQPGIFDHGRINQDQLILDKSSATIHYYGCTYPEIDCISLRESAAVGCVPVTTTCGVFAEKEYCIKVQGEPNTKETQEAVAYKIVELLKNPEELAIYREKFKTLALLETWDKIAKIWLENFDK